MKNIFLALVFIVSIVVNNSAFAQTNKDKEDKIETLQVAFITKRLELTIKEAQDFWPVYNEYTEKLEKLRKDRRKQYKNAKEKMDLLSDKEMEVLVDAEMDFRQKEVDIQKEYNSKFKKVLPVKKVAKLYMAEEAYKRHLLKKLQEQNKQ